jgi:hypothetical protein
MGEKMNAHKIFAEKMFGKCSFGRPRRRFWDNIEA